VAKLIAENRGEEQAVVRNAQVVVRSQQTVVRSQQTVVRSQQAVVTTCYFNQTPVPTNLKLELPILEEVQELSKYHHHEVSTPLFLGSKPQQFCHLD